MAEPETRPDLIRRFREAWGRRPAGETVLAVSGGSDSTALMHLVAEAGDRPAVVTVDHGLRAEGAAEAQMVADAAASLGLNHETLRWTAPDRGNLQGEARAGRYAMIAAFAKARGAGTIVTAHTLDDQAETVLMRLIRGSGIDGLAAMQECGETHGLALFRPLLGERREALRAWLSDRDIRWIEDPSNEDTRFDRVRVRQAMEALGLEPARLAQTADHMARARHLLDRLTDDWIDAHVASHQQGASFQRTDFTALHPELRLRILAHLLSRIGRQGYRPRFRALCALDQAIGEDFRGSTLHGCLIRADGPRLVIEPEAVTLQRRGRGASPPGSAHWQAATFRPLT